MSKTKGWIILAILATIVGLIGIGSIVITAANAAGSTGTPTPTTNPGNGQGKGHGKGHGPKATLTVTNVSGQKITAKQQNGTSVTITTTSSTIYKRAGQSVSASAVTTGTTIHVRGTKNSAGSITAAQIDIVLPGYHGVVTSVTSNSIAVQDHSGASRTIKITSSTTFVRAGQTVSLSAVTKGANIGAVGIIMLTAREEVDDRVTGLDLGADDYVTKPFAFKELMARTRAVLRRHGKTIGDTVTFHGITLDRATRIVTRDGISIELTPREFDLLEVFLMNPRQVLTRDVILARVWGYDYEGDDNIIEVYVRHLREKLHDNPPQLLQTVRGVGYTLRE
ncbi:MAG: hypothetical protein NVS4B11_11770 [Ktedonobacteraceae bacterium]